MIEVLLIAALLYWVAAPDPVTAGARTASGTAARAAGTGVRAHWAAGRPGRQARRTKRRDRWWKAGGMRRAALRGEHAAVWTCGAAKTTAGLAAAAARPVPAAAKKGWSGGQERHRNRAGSRRVVLDPPWWRREQPQVQPGEQGTEQPAEQVQVQPQVQVENSPEVLDWDTRTNIPADLRCQRCDIGRYRYTYDGVRVCAACAAELDRLADDDRPGDPNQGPLKPGAVPADTTTSQPSATTQGGSMSIPTELRNLSAVQDFAQQVDNLSESSDFIVAAEKARTVGENSRTGGFGQEMDLAVDSLEETARRFAQSVDDFRATAHRLAKTSVSVRGS